VIQAVVAARAAVNRTSTTSLARSAVLCAQVALLAIAYYLGARLGLGFRFQNSQIGVVWPPNALLIAALVLVSRRRWWIVFAATALVHALVMGLSVPAWRVAWQIIANSAYAATTAAVLQRLAGFPLHFGSRRQVLVYTAASFAMPALFAFTAPAFVLSLLQFDSAYTPASALCRASLSNATAMLLVGPVAILWGDYGVRRLIARSRRRLTEAALLAAALLAAGVVAFGTGPQLARFPSLLLWVFPPLLWAAVRFGPIGASTALLGVAALSGLGTAWQLGPFVVFADADQVLSLQLFWIVLCPPVMLLAAVIRERERAEDALREQRNQLAHVTRVATVGELSGALAHELRQPLMSILANAQAGTALLLRERANLHELRAILKDIADQDKQAAGVIARLRSFIKEGESHLEPLAVDAVARDALELGRSSVEIWGVAVQTQFAPGLPPVRGDRVQLLQVLLNLVVNACDSMNGIPVAERRLLLQVDRLGQDHVDVSIADRGVGLPVGGEDRVFEPFFTTKAKGLGLGLAIGRSIATAHGGRLWGENNLRGGATFHLVLPTDQQHDGRPIHRDC
jgi:signal transduction histidine kinase